MPINLSIFLYLTVVLSNFKKYYGLKLIKPHYNAHCDESKFTLFTKSAKQRKTADVTTDEIISSQQLRKPKGLGSEINNQIMSCFQDNNNHTSTVTQMLKDILLERKDLITHVHVITLLQRSAKYNINILNVATLKDYETILLKSKATLVGKEIGSLLYALKSMDDNTPGIQSFLATLTLLVHGSTDVLNGADISSALYGLHRLTDTHQEMRDLLSVLTPKIFQSLSIMTSPEIGSAFYGLKNMGDSEEVQAVIAALTPKVLAISDLHPQAFSMILFSLRNFQNNNAAVKQLLKVLVPKILTSTTDTNCQNIGQALFGLRCMTADSREVTNILSALSVKIYNSSIPYFNHDSLSSVISGLRSMNSDVLEVRIFIRTICRKLNFMDDTNVLLDKLHTPILTTNHPANALEGGANKNQKKTMEKDFRKANTATSQNMKTPINGELGLMTPNTLAHALYGLRNMRSNYTEIQSLLGVISNRMGTYSDDSSPKFSSREVGLALYGLKGMSDEQEIVRTVLRKLCQAIQNSIGNISGRDFASAVYGLQSMTRNSIEARNVLSALTKKLRKSNLYKFSATDTGTCLFGLQGFSCEFPEVIELVKELSKKIGVLDSQAIGNGLYGLRRMTSNVPEVLTLLATVAPAIEASTAPLSPQELSNAFFGMQGMDSDYAEVEAIVAALLTKLSACSGPFTTQGLTCSLCGLQSMSTNSSTVRLVLRLLEPKFRQCTESFSAHELSSCLFGLQGMDALVPEVQAILSQLESKLSQSIDQFQAQDIGRSLVGMSNMAREVPEVAAVMSQLSIKVAFSEFKGQANLQFLLFGKAVRIKIGGSYGRGDVLV